MSDSLLSRTATRRIDRPLSFQRSYSVEGFDEQSWRTCVHLLLGRQAPGEWGAQAHDWVRWLQDTNAFSAGYPAWSELERPANDAKAPNVAFDTVQRVIEAIRSRHMTFTGFHPVLHSLLNPDIQRVLLNLIWPKNEAWLATWWGHDGLVCALAVVRYQDNTFRIVGPKTLLEWTGPLGGDWQRDYRVVKESVEERLAVPVFGMHTTLEGWKKLTEERKPGTLISKFTFRELIIDPRPWFAGALLGFDALHGIESRTGLLTRMVSSHPVFRLGMRARRLWSGASTIASKLELDVPATLNALRSEFRRK